MKARVVWFHFFLYLRMLNIYILKDRFVCFSFPFYYIFMSPGRAAFTLNKTFVNLDFSSDTDFIKVIDIMSFF